MGNCYSSISLTIRFTIQVSEQQIRMEVMSRHHLVATLGFPQVRVNDGEWHHLLVELKSVKEGKDIKYMAAVSLDYDMYQVLSAASHLKDNLHFGQVFN